MNLLTEVDNQKQMLLCVRGEVSRAVTMMEAVKRVISIIAIILLSDEYLGQ